MAQHGASTPPKFVPHVGDVTLSHVEVWWPGGKVVFTAVRPDDVEDGIWRPKYYGNEPTFKGNESDWIVLNVYGSVKHCKSCKCRDAFLHLEMVMVVKRQLTPSHYIAELKWEQVRDDTMVLRDIKLKTPNVLFMPGAH